MRGTAWIAAIVVFAASLSTAQEERIGQTQFDFAKVTSEMVRIVRLRREHGSCEGIPRLLEMMFRDETDGPLPAEDKDLLRWAEQSTLQIIQLRLPSTTEEGSLLRIVDGDLKAYLRPADQRKLGSLLGHLWFLFLACELKMEMKTICRVFSGAMVKSDTVSVFRIGSGSIEFPPAEIEFWLKKSGIQLQAPMGGSLVRLARLLESADALDPDAIHPDGIWPRLDGDLAFRIAKEDRAIHVAFQQGKSIHLYFWLDGRRYGPYGLAPAAKKDIMACLGQWTELDAKGVPDQRPAPPVPDQRPAPPVTDQRPAPPGKDQ